MGSQPSFANSLWLLSSPFQQETPDTQASYKFSCRDNECFLKLTPLSFPSQLGDFTVSYFRILKYVSHEEI